MNLTEVTVPALAYLGDAVLENCVRFTLVESGLSTSRHLNDASRAFVVAGAQAEAVKKILPLLTEEETVVYHRGRNYKVGHVPKNATVTDYHMATGMECLFGYLALKKDTDRIDTLFRIGYADALTTRKGENT